MGVFRNENALHAFSGIPSNSENALTGCQSPERRDITQGVSWLIHRGFRQEGAVGKAGIAQQPAEGRSSDHSFANMFMAVEFRSSRGLGVVAMPNPYGLKADGSLNLLHGFGVALFTDDVISGDVNVTGIQAHGNRSAGTKRLDKFRDLLQRTAEGKLGSGGILNQNPEVGALPGQTIDGLLNRLCGQPQALIAGQALPASRVQDQKLRSQSQGALYLATKSGNGVGPHTLCLRAHVDQVAGMNRHGADVVLLAQFLEPGRIGRLHRTGLPHTRTGGEDLEGVGAAFDGAGNGCVHTAGRGEVNADTLLCNCHLFSITAMV